MVREQPREQDRGLGLTYFRVEVGLPQRWVVVYLLSVSCVWLATTATVETRGRLGAGNAAGILTSVPLYSTIIIIVGPSTLSCLGWKRRGGKTRGPDGKAMGPVHVMIASWPPV